ncbi:hypothetical protein HK100_010589 [Physocladia obscura]|uniref:F-box domain-containing protein n=1 Tax=Physocladia obscura TaxID=109957 RepID=A0AAD5TBK9_9FUNG|nr:hypothetical protein HK100_010589 [Physocladia obscura]
MKRQKTNTTSTMNADVANEIGSLVPMSSNTNSLLAIDLQNPAASLQIIVDILQNVQTRLSRLESLDASSLTPVSAGAAIVTHDTTRAITALDDGTLDARIQKLENRFVKFNTKFSQLPFEIITLIFSWVPLKSVFKFRLLAKAMDACITSRHMATLMLSRFDMKAYLNQRIRYRNENYVWLMWPANLQHVYAEMHMKNVEIFNIACCSAPRIPAALGTLTKIQQLSLANAVWSGSSEEIGKIPNEIGLLVNLKHLDLSCNALRGELPHQILGSLVNLTLLNLSKNKFEGAIDPTVLGKLTRLTNLNLAKNELTGAIPKQIGKLTNLQYLYLNNNKLTGAIPSQITKLGDLRILELNNNSMTGKLPRDFGQHLARLTHVQLHNNRFTGKLTARQFPAASLTGLVNVKLKGNGFVGRIGFDLMQFEGMRERGGAFELDEENRPANPSLAIRQMLGDFEDDDEEEDDDDDEDYDEYGDGNSSDESMFGGGQWSDEDNDDASGTDDGSSDGGVKRTNTQTRTRIRVVIVGGGIAGLALAVALKRLDARQQQQQQQQQQNYNGKGIGVGFSVLVVEAATSTSPALSEDGTHVLLWRWALDALVGRDSLALGAALSPLAAPIVNMSTLNPQDLHAAALRQFPPPPSKLAASTQLHSALPPLVSIRRCDLVRVLMRALAECNAASPGDYAPRAANNSQLADAFPPPSPAAADLAEGRWFEAQGFAARLGPGAYASGDRVRLFYVHPTSGRVTVELRSGRVVAADVLVGADGPASQLRRLMYQDLARAVPRTLLPASPSANTARHPRPAEYSGAAVFCGVTRLHVPPTDAPDYLEASNTPIQDLTRADIHEFVPDGRCVTVCGSKGAAWFGCTNLGNGLVGWRLVVAQDEKGQIAANYAAAKNRQLMNEAIKANPRSGVNIMSIVGPDAVGGPGVTKKLGYLATDETNPEDKWNSSSARISAVGDYRLIDRASVLSDNSTSSSSSSNINSLPRNRKPGVLRMAPQTFITTTTAELDELSAEAVPDELEGSASSVSSSLDSRKSDFSSSPAPTASTIAAMDTKRSRRGRRSIDMNCLQNSFKENSGTSFSGTNNNMTLPLRKYSESSAASSPADYRRASSSSQASSSSRATFVASSLFGAPNPLSGQEIRMLALRHAEPEKFPHPIYAIIARTDPTLTTLSDTVDLATKPLETFTLPNPNPPNTPPPPSLHRGRVFLIGSAAHPITTNANGSIAPSLAITDAVLLAKLLAKHLDPQYTDPSLEADILTPPANGLYDDNAEGFEKFMAGAMNTSSSSALDETNLEDDDDDEDPVVRRERAAYERVANEYDAERVALASEVMREARRESGRFNMIPGSAKALLNSSVVKGLWRMGKGLLAGQGQSQGQKEEKEEKGDVGGAVNEESLNFDFLMTRGAVKKGLPQLC